MNSTKIIKYLFASLSLFFSFSVIAESQPNTYRYGTKLDIVKVLSVSAPKTNNCKIVDQTMRYIDSTGKVRTLKYRAHSGACSKGH
ncbi:DUF2790 domain-containing protein [Pseudomonas sp. Marseille-Q0931]|uniref:DUF2790 domain-containing protein n=1 Tax=Pseudomonas sp. Marseille-Q0931 TaxID=2697507 RepID=UPI0023B92968|nr:DUF2790 domain-containing protein [Pseudomonas sp. Marseille-Q0931]